MAFETQENRILYKQGDAVLAEVTFPVWKENVVNIDHTFVDEALRGQGVAGQLMQRTAEELRRSGRKAIATCSYAKKWFAQHEEYRDVLKES